MQKKKGLNLVNIVLVNRYFVDLSIYKRVSKPLLLKKGGKISMSECSGRKDEDKQLLKRTFDRMYYMAFYGEI